MEREAEVNAGKSVTVDKSKAKKGKNVCRSSSLVERRGSKTCIKEVVKWSPATKESIEDKIGGRKVFMAAATLRPETK